MFDKFNNTEAKMQEFIQHMTLASHLFASKCHDSAITKQLIMHTVIHIFIQFGDFFFNLNITSNRIKDNR